jgi:hypothetical protein
MSEFVVQDDGFVAILDTAASSAIGFVPLATQSPNIFSHSYACRLCAGHEADLSVRMLRSLSGGDCLAVVTVI